ncbi:MAG TPA: hypothetical protein VGG07_15290 [Solirubrobacteraceae bacterium]|jgi:uncharacterized repeat protein (TIGR01451 family)
MRRTLGLLGAILCVGLVFGPATASAVTGPAITVQFSAAHIPLNGETNLTLTIANSNASALTGVGFTDTFPAGVVVATPVSGVSTCGGAAAATAGGDSLALSGGTIASSGSCTVGVEVEGTTAGIKNNSVHVSSTQADGNTGSGSLTVVSPPSITLQFGAPSFPLHGSTSLTFTIENTNGVTALSGLAFSDQLPAGLATASPANVTNSCAGTTTAPSNGTTVSLSGGTLGANASCTISIDVTGVAAGTQVNSVTNLTSTEGGDGGAATSSVLILVPLTLSVAFDPAVIAPGQSSQLKFTITNPAGSTSAATGIALSDPLPSGLTIATGTSTACGGTLTTDAGTRTIALSGGTINAQSSCQFTVTVGAATVGEDLNTTGAVSSTNDGTGSAASATLTVANPPTIAEKISRGTIDVGHIATLTITISNPADSFGLTGLAVDDRLPAGLRVAPSPAAANTCGGTVAAQPRAGVVTLGSGTIAAGASCTVSVAVLGAVAGTFDNAVQATSSDSPPGNTAHLAVVVVPSNAFKLSHVHGLRVDVKVTGSGKIAAGETSGFRVASATARATHAGTVHLRLKLTKRGRRLFRGHKVTLHVTFTPTGGKPRTQTVRGVVIDL